MVELAEWQERFRALGVEVAAMTFDPPEVLRAFHAEHDLGYPLLRDENARHVQAYGVLNPEYPRGHRAWGVSLPGVLFVTPDGTVREKFAVPGYRERPPMAHMLERVAARVEQREAR